MRSFILSILRGILKFVIVTAIVYFFVILYFTKTRPQTLTEFQDLLVKSFSTGEKVKMLNTQMHDRLQKIDSDDEFSKNAMPAALHATTTGEMQNALNRLQSEVDELKEQVRNLESENRLIKEKLRN